MDFVFPAGSSIGAVRCIDVTIIDSPTMEDDETFTVTLTTPNVFRIALFSKVVTVTITDTDCKFSRK